MKIVALDSKQTTKDSVVLIIEPLLSEDVFDVFQQNLPNQRENPGIRITYERGNIRVHSAVIPTGYTEWLERLFREAKGLIDHMKNVEEDKKRIEALQKQEILDAAAKRTGLPIR